MHGLAVKAALQLGLQSTEALKRYEPLEQEIRKRTWFGCVVLDRHIALTLARLDTLTIVQNSEHDFRSAANHT